METIFTKRFNIKILHKQVKTLCPEALVRTWGKCAIEGDEKKIEVTNCSITQNELDAIIAAHDYELAKMEEMDDCCEVEYQGKAFHALVKILAVKLGVDETELKADVKKAIKDLG